MAKRPHRGATGGKRPLWRGHLKLSLVTCPVALYSALDEGNDFRFNFLNPKTGNRIRNEVIDAETGAAVERADLVRGYQYAKDRYVVLTDEELDELRIESSSTMTIDRFVPMNEIGPVYFDNAYYVTPDGEAGQEAFAVIREAMLKTRRMAITRVVLSRRERVIALEPEGRGMLAHSLREASEVKDASEYFAGIESVKADSDMLSIATKLVEQKSGPFKPADYEDRYEARLKQLIDAKLKGVDLDDVGEEEAPSNVVDLMDALKRSLSGDKGKPAKAGPATVHKLKPKRKAPSPKAAPRKKTRKAG